MVKNLSVEVLGLCFLKHCFKELPWKGFVPYQGLSGISIDLDTVRLHMYLYFGTINNLWTFRMYFISRYQIVFILRSGGNWLIQWLSLSSRKFCTAQLNSNTLICSCVVYNLNLPFVSGNLQESLRMRWGTIPSVPVHCSHMERGPKFVKMGTKRGPDFEWNGDQKGTKWGPKKRIFDKLTETC